LLKRHARAHWLAAWDEVSRSFRNPVPIELPTMRTLAFVLTRPLGATMGDLLTKTHTQGGLGFGTIGSSLILAVILVVVIVATRNDARRRRQLTAEAGGLK
jgi:hypothetical protein